MKKTKSYLLCAIALSGLLFLNACDKTDTQPQINTPTPTTSPNPNPEVSLVYTKKTTPVLFEFTSTGCGGCGSWGKPTFASLINSNIGGVIPLAVHIKYGDPMITPESLEIGSNRFGSRYTPQLWVDDENAVVLVNGGINGSASVQNANQLIATNTNIEQPALAAIVKKENGMLKVKYGVKFIDMEADGEYSLSCFLTEDGIKAFQAGYANNPATHNHIIRKSDGGTFGKSITKADLIDMEMNWEHSFDMAGFVADNTYVTLILWKKVGGRYQPVNGYVAK